MSIPRYSPAFPRPGDPMALGYPEGFSWDPDGYPVGWTRVFDPACPAYKEWAPVTWENLGAPVPRPREPEVYTREEAEEAIHAKFGDLPEWAVESMARTLARASSQAWDLFHDVDLAIWEWDSELWQRNWQYLNSQIAPEH